MRQDFREQQEWWSQLDEDVGERVRVRPPKSRSGKPKPAVAQIRSELAEELYQPEAEYNFTYQAARHERQWISTALQSFYDDSLIADVLSIVKGGKEANVYCCRAQGTENPGKQTYAFLAGPLKSHPDLDTGLLAAKIYRPRPLRNLKNDALYKEGRLVLDDEGKKRLDGRSLRAIQKKTRRGAEMSITSWIEYEYQTLSRLYAAGVHVPEPVAQSGNAILMAYIGEAGNPAPTLNNVSLRREEAPVLFGHLIGDVRLMLEQDLIHADLSAYNVLYWEGAVTIIDFPQAVDPLGNRNSFDMLRRDIQRLCDYFARYGVRSNPQALAGELWTGYERRR